MPLDRVMRLFNHTRVTMLNFDCNGCETAVLADLEERQLGHLLQHTEVLHARFRMAGGAQASEQAQQLVRAARLLQRANFKPVHRHARHAPRHQPQPLPPLLAQAGFDSTLRWMHVSFVRSRAPPPTLSASTAHPVDDVYALMVTGRDEYRMALASLSFESFLRQTFCQRHLVIVNDGQQSAWPFLRAALWRMGPQGAAAVERCADPGGVAEEQIEPGVVRRRFECLGAFLHCNDAAMAVVEIAVDNSDRRFKLGALRNFALAEVPDGNVFVQWDDDDWHHPDYITSQYRAFRGSSASACLLRQQVMYNFLYDAATIKESTDGLYGTIMGVKTPGLAYPDLAKSEDKHFVANFVDIFAWDNPPKMYLRMVHMGNTWHLGHFTGALGPLPGSRVAGSDAVINRTIPKYKPLVLQQFPNGWPLSRPVYLLHLALWAALVAAAPAFLLYDYCILGRKRNWSQLAALPFTTSCRTACA